MIELVKIHVLIHLFLFIKIKKLHLKFKLKKIGKRLNVDGMFLIYVTNAVKDILKKLMIQNVRKIHVVN